MGILPANLPANDEGDDDLGSGDEEDEEDDEDEDDDEDEAKGSVLMGAPQRQGQAKAQEPRQYSEETARVLWVSYPALHPELNLHVWEAAGKAMPLIRSGPGAVEDEGGLFGDGARLVPPVEGEEQTNGEGEIKYEEENSLAQEFNAHPGAGTGVIGGAGSSLNHVVAVEWSPSGLGKNLRPVLAVLTGCGSLAVYGEGGPLPFGSNAKPSRIMGSGKSAVRDLQSWLVLWAVGENFVVPGQEEFGYGEFVKAFAWCQEVGAGRALLSYMNDLREIVVLSVCTTFRKTEEGLDEATWNVQEITRMETGGPHGHVDVSFCVNGEAIAGTDAINSLVIQTMSHLDQATAYDGAHGSKKRPPGPVYCPTWIETTLGSRRSFSTLLHGARRRLLTSYVSPQTGMADVSILQQTPS